MKNWLIFLLIFTTIFLVFSTGIVLFNTIVQSSITQAEMEIFNTPDEVKIKQLSKDMVGKQVKIPNAIWYFSEKDENKVTKIFQVFRRIEGVVVIQAEIYCKKPDGVVLFGALEFNFDGAKEKYHLVDIHNVNAEIVKEYN